MGGCNKFQPVQIPISLMGLILKGIGIELKWAVFVIMTAMFRIVGVVGWIKIVCVGLA